MPTDEELVKGNLTVKIPGAEKEINLIIEKLLIYRDKYGNIFFSFIKKLLN